ncbi:MAG: SLC13 family permease [Bacteroidia bacterium]|nr:SLC13 family permease [Bacteroidia bacterium]
MEQIFIAAILVLLILLLIKSKLHPALLFVSAALIFSFAGMIEVQELLTYYANETLITLLLLLHVSVAVEKSNLILFLSKQIFKKKSFHGSLFRLSFFTMLFSGILNNTAIVATLMGTVKNNPHKFAPSRLLIPLSYSAIMGGVLTLIGTSTNLIVNSFTIKAGLEPIGFFDFFYVGAPIALIGLLYVVLVLPHLLPRQGWEEDEDTVSYFLEAEVRAGASIIGKSITENGLRNMDHLFLAEIIRDNRLISPVEPNQILREGDILVFTGAVSKIQELRKFPGLEIQEKGTEEILDSNLQEVVVRHTSPLLGRRIKDANFRTKFDAVVVAVSRGDEKLSGKIGNIKLQTGDELVLATGAEFYRHENLRRNFSILNPLDPDGIMTSRESWITVGLFLIGLVTAATGLLSLFQAMVLLLLAYLGLGYLKFKQLKNNLNVSLLLMIGSALGISQVISEYGLADLISSGILDFVGMGSPVYALAGIYLATLITTEVITNNAAAALMFPIAIATATLLEVSPIPFIMAIAYAASASFLTPIGYQTNTMVYAVGKYKFGDYFKGGIVLSLLYAVMVITLVPYFFPF